MLTTAQTTPARMWKSTTSVSVKSNENFDSCDQGGFVCECGCREGIGSGGDCGTGLSVSGGRPAQSFVSLGIKAWQASDFCQALSGGRCLQGVTEKRCVCVSTAGVSGPVASTCFTLVALSQAKQVMATSDKHFGTHLIRMV